MSELLKVVLSLSISGTLLFFIILILKPMYKNKLSKRWQYYIWLIVIARMLLPFAPATTFLGSAFQHFDNVNVKTSQTAPAANDSQSNFWLSDGHIGSNVQPQTQMQNTDITPSNSMQAIFLKTYENLWILWAAIAFALLIRKITTYQSFVRFVKAGRAEVSDIEILNILADEEEMIGIKRPVELFVNSLISSPMLLGFFRPYIILPSTEIEKTELAYIMRHELTHYRYWDMFYKWLAQITICLHWFNPFAYILAKEINKGCELSCDEAIISTMGKDEKKAYGDTLLNSLKVVGNYNDILATVTLAESAEQLKERLDAIMKFKKTSMITVTMMFVLTLVLAVGAAAIGAYAASPVNNNANTAMIPQILSNNNSTNTSEQITVSSSGILPDNTKELTISFDIDNGGIEILPATSNEIRASYDSEYYNVTIANKNEKWVVNVTGKVAMMGKTDDVQIYIPDIKSTMDVNVLNGNFSYALPEDCTDKINVTAENAGVDFSSKNRYKNSAISLIATNKDFIKYEQPVVPNYFIKTDSGFEYTNGTGENKVSISLTGYTSVHFADDPLAVSAQGIGNAKKASTRQESLMDSFAPYRSYGLVYNVEQDRAFYNGKEVKAFVDIRDMFLGGTYSFNLGYVEPDSNSTLYLMAIRNENGSLIGIQKMSKELQNDLYDMYDETSTKPFFPELDNGIKDTISENIESKSKYLGQREKYIVFDATASVNNSSVTATDKLNSTDIPKTIADWILTCQGSDKLNSTDTPKTIADRILTYQGSDEVNVKRTIEGGMIDAWIYYDSDNRMAWKMSTDESTIKFVLTDNVPQIISGATLIHYQAPEAYQDLEVFFKSQKLGINF